jgi:heme exporter protein CcmD
MQALLNMGGYGAYIWPAYGISFLALGGAALGCWRAWAKAKARLAALEGKS